MTLLFPKEQRGRYQEIRCAQCQKVLRRKFAVETEGVALITGLPVPTANFDVTWETSSSMAKSLIETYCLHLIDEQASHSITLMPRALWFEECKSLKEAYKQWNETTKRLCKFEDMCS